MNKVADILFLLATFSLRASYLEKAEIYARAARTLFPNDLRIAEVFALVLITRGDLDAAADVLEDSTLDSANAHYLRTRLSLMSGKPKEDVLVPMNRYLSMS